MKQLPIVVLKGCPYERATLYSLCVLSGFDGRAGFDVNSSLFPQGVLAAITLVGGRAGDGGARAIARCELGLPLCSVAVFTLLGWGVRSDSKLLEQNPECWV